jgi:hypothetical protein
MFEVFFGSGFWYRASDAILAACEPARFICAPAFPPASDSGSIGQRKWVREMSWLIMGIIAGAATFIAFLAAAVGLSYFSTRETTNGSEINPD